ncbi:hypothetical protein RJI07_08830 [Mycoplasmatota bacterium WC30]
MSGHRGLKWYKLDKAAKIYPLVTNERYTYNFRVSAVLKETINEEVLYQAILDSRKRFPMYFVKLKRGLFWYYFEENLLPPILAAESPFICNKKDEYFNNKYLFTFLYYNKRISLEINHALTDGGGAIMFLNAVVYHYLELLGKELTPDANIMLVKDEVHFKETEDSYGKNYSGGGLNPPKTPNAYIYKGKTFKNFGSGVINSYINSKELIKLVKSEDSNITQYVVALLIYSIIVNGNKKKLKKKPINICVPINLRTVYDSKTLNNFSLTFYISYQMKSETPDLNDILKEVEAEFIKKKDLQGIQNTLDTVCVIQRKSIVRFIPLPIKYILFKIGYAVFGRLPTTITFSNFGVVKIPESMEKHIESFSFYMGSAMKHAVAMNSYAGKTSIVFSRAFIDTKLEETFFSFLSSKGLHVEVTSNYWEKNAKRFFKQYIIK